ncbi:hypothetical protein F4803DRAFT_508221 [Xylaria telfairii]|nr:hypothetical protein F4803DRAFT_508221 [Xylaria telfairii]
MTKLFVRSRGGGPVRTFDLTAEDTVASMRQKIREILQHEGHVKMFFPSKKIDDHEKLLSHFPKGVTIDVDLEGDIETGEGANEDPYEQPYEEADVEAYEEADEEADEDDTSGDGLINDLKIESNRVSVKADQINAIVGVTCTTRGRATKAHVVKNQAEGSSKQINAVLTDPKNFEILMNGRRT